MALGEFGFQRFQADAQAVLRQPRAAGEDGVDVVQAQHVAPDQTGRFGGAIAPQLFLPASGFIGGQDRRGGRRGAVVAQQGFQPIRLAAQGFQGEVAGQDHPADARGAGGIGQQFGRGGRGFAQAGQAAFDQRFEIGVGNRGVVIHITGLWHAVPALFAGATSVASGKLMRKQTRAFPQGMRVMGRSGKARLAVATDVAPTGSLRFVRRPARDPAGWFRVAGPGRTARPVFPAGRA